MSACHLVAEAPRCLVEYVPVCCLMGDWALVSLDIESVGLVQAPYGFCSRGVVNRDLKPENLLLKKKYNGQEVSCTMENLRCVDFGSAAQLEAGAMPCQALTHVHSKTAAWQELAKIM